VTPLAGPFGYALSVDVEEWFHTCMEPDYVDPERRPRLPCELDRLLPALVELLAAHGRTATFFVLGEVARALPGRVRELAAAGHEVASHGFHHLRVGELSLRRFRGDVADSRALLEDIVGSAVRGYRAPEWSLRELGNPRLPVLAELGLSYDSSLAPTPGSGSLANPVRASLLSWADGLELLELPPLTFAGRLRVPASGWPGRLAGSGRVAEAARRHRAAGGLPVLVVHPWEVASRPTPGELTGLARWVHELGRGGFAAGFAGLLAALPWTSLSHALPRR
jgi:peptidoglycan/xylan/chitin deacetylase (PgdA/CDA1 family)